MMISVSDYLGPWASHPDCTEARKDSALVLLDKVNALLEQAEANGVEMHTNPHTKTMVAGEAYGGFRPQDAPVGAPHSNHKEGHAVDVYDPLGDLDRWLTDGRLEAAGLAREHPSCTGTWTHLQDVLPTSGHRTFYP
jgi:hypothetical protein